MIQPANPLLAQSVHGLSLRLTGTPPTKTWALAFKPEMEFPAPGSSKLSTLNTSLPDRLMEPLVPSKLR